MEQVTGRPRVAKAYAWLISLAALVVVVQGFLFAAFYSEAEKASLRRSDNAIQLKTLYVETGPFYQPLEFFREFFLSCFKFFKPPSLTFGSYPRNP